MSLSSFHIRNIAPVYKRQISLYQIFYSMSHTKPAFVGVNLHVAQACIMLLFIYFYSGVSWFSVIVTTFVLGKGFCGYTIVLITKPVGYLLSEKLNDDKTEFLLFGSRQKLKVLVPYIPSVMLGQLPRCKLGT